MSTRVLACLVGGALVLMIGAGCGAKSDSGAPAPAATAVLSTPTQTPVETATPPPTTTTKATAAAAQWPTPEDCVSYNPNNVTVHYEAGVYQVSDGSKVIMRLAGGPGDTIGDKGAALAKHYRRHCFIGRANTREDKNLYVFDYWRDASGLTSTIPGQEDDCSAYNKNNLTVEDMGSGNGWRVKDHDHVLQLFDRESEARNGRLVLAKYGQICVFGSSDDPNTDVISYLL
jgi:hypothetical protein